MTTSVPFRDGAKIAVTTKPGLDRFERLRGDLGETDLVPTRAGVLTATAQGLASRRGDPRLVTLTLSVGKPAP